MGCTSSTASTGSNESNGSNDSNTPLLPQAKPDRRQCCNMVLAWNQFWLLFWKNWKLALRSKIWVLFELLIPCLITFPIILIVVKYANTEDIPSRDFVPTIISGNKDDITRKAGFTDSIHKRWRRDLVKIGYNTDFGGSELNALIQQLSNRFADSDPPLEFVKFSNEQQMLLSLKNDIINVTTNEYGYSDYIGKFAAGIEFKELDTKQKKLQYRIHLPNLPTSQGDVFSIATNWDDPYGPPPADHNRLPPKPPYWSSAFLTFQYALDSVFINMTGGSEIPEVRLQRLPEPPYRVHSVGAFIKYLPILWGMCAFLAVLHAGREVAHEKFTVKAFLSVMGLSSPMFYWSHIIFSWIKCMIIFLLCAIPLTTVMANVSISLFLFMVFLYGLGAVCFGVLVASMFKTPNTVIKVILLSWIILIALPYIKPVRTEQIFLCFVTSININGAFYFAVQTISDNMYRESPLGWLNMFESGSYNFVIGYALLMMVFDIVWMSALTMIFDLVLDSEDFSLRGFFARENVEEIDANRGFSTEDEKDEAQNMAKPDIEVKHLVKIWSETGERAVDGLSLKCSSGMVTVLLGHNGAGKSTTFSILCGLIKPTAGSVKVCDEDVYVGQTHRNVGLCPQGNALFDKLTVNEHLRLINGLKGDKNDWKGDGMRLKNALGLMEKSNELSMNLSGGMRRKLCVCLALIGGSKVVLLDEPTAGMDPGARRDVEKLLVEEKRTKTILLTTHYMDEAELLGDRVAIMSKGRIAAVGTPEVLKRRYGTGYILTIVVEDNTEVTNEINQTDGSMKQYMNTAKMSPEHINAIEKFVQKYIPGARASDVHGYQLEIVLPKTEQKKFPALLDRIESEQKNLKISSFGLSLNTLEQVFLRVGEEAEKEDVQYIDSEGNLNTELIRSQNDPKKEGIRLILAQLVAIFTKRILYSIRNWPHLMTQVLAPLLILIFITWLSNYQFSYGGNDYTRNLNRDDFGPSRVVVQTFGKSPIADTYKELIKSWSGSELVELSGSENITAKIIALPKTMPPTGMGAVFNGPTVNVLFNVRSPHAISTTINLLSNARLRSLGQGSIFTGIYAYSQPASTSKPFNSSIIDNILGPMMMVALALVTSTFVMFYVDERKSKFAHQQSLTGISPLVFWGGSLAYDFIFYTIICFSFWIFFMISNWLHSVIGFVLLLWFLYFWAVMPFIYTVSFMFSSPSKANVLLVIWQIVAAIAAIIIIVLVTVLIPQGMDRTTVEITRTALLMFLPSFALGNGLMTLGLFSSIPFTDPKALWEWDQLGKNIVCMIIFGLFSSIVFIAFQFKVVRRAFSKIWDIKITFNRENTVAGDEIENGDSDDDDVYREANVVRQRSHNSTFLLEVNDMSKQFGAIKAVDHLTMGIYEGECFGLLGVNGAGKTTTFDILTGQSFPTHGYAKIDNKDVTKHIAIGYCPQFDAMMMDYTGREILEMIARMYGFENPRKKADLVLRAVGMENHGNKLVRYYSGGQRRKISVGLALLACTKIVILDEPTAGIDPKARRDVWNVLTAVRDHSKSSLLLTSHSMDECEALCTRIGILRKGRMIAIGASQHLKSKFGDNFTLTFVLTAPKDRDDVINEVKLKFPSSQLKTQSSNTSTLRWQLTRERGDKWSTKFAECQKLADSLGDRVTDFCLTQSSLEETFLRISETKDQTSSESIS